MKHYERRVPMPLMATSRATSRATVAKSHPMT